MLSEYKEVFLEELDEQLQLMDEVIMQLERNCESGEVIQSLFRAAHTLKGSSAAMGFEEMKRLTHRMEHLLDLVRSKERTVTPSMIELLFRSLDSLKLMKEDILSQDCITVDVSACLQALERFDSEEEGAAAPGPQTGNPDAEGTPAGSVGSGAARPELSLSIRLHMTSALEQGLRLSWVSVRLSPNCFIQGARAYVIQTMLAEWGEVLLASPDYESIGETGVDGLELTYLYAGTQEPAELAAMTAGLADVASAHAEPVLLEETEMDYRAAASVSTDAAQAREHQDHRGHQDHQDASSAAVAVSPRQPASPPSASPPSAPQPSAAVKPKAQTIRVSVERLDDLMNLVGELVIDQTRIQQVARTQRRRFQDDSVGELGHIADHLSRIIGDLQESVMKARMLPIEQLMGRFPRMIRDLSRDLGKELELVMEGQDTELDRTLIEEIADPLIHLIRNAVDHGLELPEVRERAGKPRQGILRIKAAHEDNQVVIYVEDDGAGIDPAKMRSSAVRKGIITQEEADALGDREAIDLIFRPGFSTAQQVSDVSGRGVGMDIVASHLEKLNGMIDIRSELGRGTTFKIKLPLTLAIIVGLLVKCNGQTLIIPMSNIAEIVRVPAEEIRTVRGQPVVLIRNQVIPVADIRDKFGIPGADDGRKQIPLVIIGSAEKRLALTVDELIGNQEIVIKSLGSYIGKVEGIAGATILGDGSVALILEISALFGRMAVR
ncbi:two-component system, chemotaxis family, sensor kinase CheA [Cohnella sp. OV330]|uniref:chemotaxis protein CheA n=1 Tax=Cohnella sp. OV330 TaxID=1855288 RepID=UPI0008F3F5F8|nr:chemotaxis protein CheA [Cohnella sp. OV330]SFB54107.1 two-component system, chemotaxis family, sensor kinase CheA [Cohnella sp. OV330]